MNYKVKESDLIGEIKDFPIEVVQKMVDYQVEQGNEADVEAFQQSRDRGRLDKGFKWKKTPEGYDFWVKVIERKNFDLFFEKYPKPKPSIFKVGDKVFDPYNGWGEVVEVGDHSIYPILVRFKRMGISSTYTYTACGKYRVEDNFPKLSFTEYDPTKATGFSQKRPFPEVKDGQLVYVRSSFNNEWLMRYATGNISERGLETYPNQQKSGETVFWEKYILTHPLENKE